MGRTICPPLRNRHHRMTPSSTVKRILPPLPHRPRLDGHTWAHLLAGGLVLLYIIIFARLAILRHASFDSAGFDLGVYDQVVWNTLHGRIFFYTTTGQPLLHLSNHADPILLLMAPFYLIYSGPQMLLLLQAAVIGLGGLPVYWLGREKLGSDLAGLSLLLAYLLFPALQVVALSDFHPPALAVGFLLYAFYFLERQKLWGVLLFSILAMACKEQIPLVVILMGIYAIVRHRNWRIGLATAGLGLAWFVVVMYWVIPAHSVTGSHIFLDYYSDLGDSPLQILITAVTHPALVFTLLWEPSKLNYLRDVLAPFAFLPLVGLPVLLIGLPSFAINLLSANPAMHDATRGHYAADLAPWLAMGAVYGAYYLRQGLTRLWPSTRRWSTIGISLVLVVVSLSWQVFRGYSPLALDRPHWSISAHDGLAQRFIGQIPPDAPIAAQGELYPHLSNRVIAYHLPVVNDAQYVFVDVASTTRTMHPNDLKALVTDSLESGQFGVQDAADGYLLLRRGLADKDIPDAFHDFARTDADSLDPQYPVSVDFGDELRLLGFDLIDDPRRQETSIRLYWQALEPVDGYLRLYPFFVDQQGDIVEDTSQRPLITQIWYPPHRWSPDEIVVVETLPWTLGPYWSLAVGVLAGPDWSDWRNRLPVEEVEAPASLVPRRFEGNTWVRLATFERRGRKLVEITPIDQDLQPSHPVPANLDGKMALRGYDVSPPAGNRGRETTVTLYWQALAPMARDYTVFVHLVGEDGQRVAQHDGEPWWEVSSPTSTWQVGERLRDRHVLALPADIPPGTYQLRVGAYFWQTGERLPVLVDNIPVSDVVEMGGYEVE